MKVVEAAEPFEMATVFKLIAQGYEGQQALSYLMKALATAEELPTTEAVQLLRAETLVEIAAILLSEDMQDPNGAVEVLQQAKKNLKKIKSQGELKKRLKTLAKTAKRQIYFL